MSILGCKKGFYHLHGDFLDSSFNLEKHFLPRPIRDQPVNALSKRALLIPRPAPLLTLYNTNVRDIISAVALMLRGRRRLPLPQSPWSGWRTTQYATAPVSAHLFSTTIPRLDDNTHSERPEKPLFHKVGVPGVEWALLHGRRGAKVNPEHILFSLEGLKPFGAKYNKPLQKEPCITTALQEARKRRDKSRKHREQAANASLTGSKRPKKSRDTKKGNHWQQKAPRDSGDCQNASGNRSLVWRSIMPRDETETVSKRSRSSSSEAPRPENQNRCSLPNNIEITINDPPQGWNRLRTRGVGDLNKAAGGSSGLESMSVAPSQVGEAIDSYAKLTAAVMPTMNTLRPLNYAEQSPQLTLPPPKPRDAILDVGDFAGAAAAMGPAESVRNSLTEDPILKEAALLSKQRIGPKFSQPSSKLDNHVEPRFRVLPRRQLLKRKNKKEPVTLGDVQTSDVSIETETQQEQNQERQVMASSSQLVTTNPTLDEMEAQILGSAILPSENGDHAATDESIKPVEPVQPERSIFEQLFSEERPRGDDYWQIADRLKAAFSAVEKSPDSDAQPEQKAPAWKPQPGQSIYGQLFPEHAQFRPEEGWRRTTEEPLSPPKDSLMISLRNEVRNWIPEDQQDRIIGPQPGEYGSHSTVVVISGASPSLIDTDFYRIALEGKHVEGWAGGLVKVVQARDSITSEPLGQYYLMFHSRPSAIAYVDELQRLHALSRKLLHAPASSGKQVARGALDQAPATPQPFLTDEEKAAVRSFTILSPNVPPYVSVRLWNTQLVADIASKSNIVDVVQTLRPEVTTPAKVLIKLNPLDGGVDPGGLTTDELWLTLRDDGRERSAPWVLANLSTGIMPIKPRFKVAQSGIKVRATPVRVPLGPDDDFYDEESGEPVVGQLPPAAAEEPGEKLGGGADRQVRFNKFVLTFTQPAIARRFVRCWHKRTIYDAVLGRSVVVDAVAIM
ncbi:hypothetical protein VM1G_04467 [Cytospora mali]|uniref:Uncharacterized protein n=1 Tax=Cytospora mali TaxID=578113 RepID=A0A194VWW6_CYTMA|nr:hypothetical protein VM1G_04467 [Valsa mali]